MMMMMLFAVWVSLRWHSDRPTRTRSKTCRPTLCCVHL